ncbi:hypothetical protein CAter10_1776 [Collimonas arenae]|nr:hypothetical protein CAter10_1776 [Collimonas arenae]
MAVEDVKITCSDNTRPIRKTRDGMRKMPYGFFTALNMWKRN